MMVADGHGGHQLAMVVGDGRYPTEASKQAYDFLASIDGMSVEASGMGPELYEYDLRNYDTDGKVQTGIDPSQLAKAILGGGLIQELMGKDVITGNDGDDILFGDSLVLPGQTEGITSAGALKVFVAERIGKDPQEVTNGDIQNYIRDNHQDFNHSTNLDNDDIIHGGAGYDIIFGGGGNDTIIGGQGDDILYGGAGDDTFKWELGDAGTTDKPAKDVIMDFGLGGDDPRGNDRIDLSELLTGEETDITAYLTLEQRDEGTVILVNSHGKLQAEGHDQEILLHGVDLAQLGAGNVDEIISSLIQQGKLSDMDGFK